MEKKYTFSFTSGNLFITLGPMVATLRLKLQNWDEVKNAIIADNLVQARTQSSLKRTTSELIPRIQTLTDPQLELLAEGTSKDQKQILWLAACKQYLFVQEFAQQIIRGKFLRYGQRIEYRDYDIFFNNIAEWDDHLDNLSELTKQKIRQVIFQMITDAELISTDGVLLPTLLSSSVAAVITADNPANLTIYNLTDQEISRHSK